MARAVNERYMALQSVCTRATITFTWWVDLFVRFVASIACRPWAFFIVALVYFCVCVSQLDGDIPLQLVLKSDGLYARDGLDDGGFAVSDVADGSDVYCGLPCDHIVCGGRDCLEIQVLWFWLRR